MPTTQSQIKLNLPLPLKKKVEERASAYGITLSSYIRHLILQDVDIPTFQASERAEKAYRQAKKDMKEGKTTVIKSKKDLEDFLNSL